MLSYPRQKQIAIVISALFVALCALYGAINPVFEAPDEVYHYPYVKYVADGLGLPVQHVGQQALWEQEGSQPPLYYVIAAGLTRWIDSDDLTTVRWMNPHVITGIPHATDNKNMVIHTSLERYPWKGTVLAVHLIRLLSLLLGLGTIWCTWRIARRALPERPAVALGAMAINALNPMFIFLSGSVNNDNLVVFLASLAMLQMVRLVQEGSDIRQRLILGVTIGLACLSKLSGLGLMAMAALAVAMRICIETWPERAPWPTVVVHEKQRRDAIGDRWALARRLLAAMVGQGLQIAGPVLIIAGWWYARNVVLYGELLGIETMLAIFGRRTILPTLLDLIAEFRGFRISFWGLFGMFNVLMRPDWVYTVLDGVLVLAVVGMALSVAKNWREHRRLPSPESLLLLIWAILVMALLLRWTSMTWASQGRLIYPAMSSVCLFLAAGLCHWVPEKGHAGVLAGVSAWLLALAIASPWTAIRPTYALPPVLDLGHIPREAQRYGATFGDGVRLVAFELDRDAVAPGEALEVTLYWQAIGSISEDYSIYIHLFGWQGERLGQRDSYPGGGRYPTTMWKDGQVIQDTFRIPVTEPASGPVAAEIEVGLYLLKDMQRLPVTDEVGQLVGRPILTRVKVAGKTDGWIGGDGPMVIRRTASSFNRQVRLLSAQVADRHAVSAGQSIPIALFWETLTSIAQDYTVFVHVVDDAGNVLGQGDGPPLSGAYPTSFWGAGDLLQDEHLITLQEGLELPDDGITARIFVGFYDLESGRRLPFVNDDGLQLGDSTVAATVRLMP